MRIPPEGGCSKDSTDNNHRRSKRKLERLKHELEAIEASRGRFFREEKTLAEEIERKEARRAVMRERASGEQEKVRSARIQRKADEVAPNTGSRAVTSPPTSPLSKTDSSPRVGPLRANSAVERPL